MLLCVCTPQACLAAKHRVSVEEGQHKGPRLVSIVGARLGNLVGIHTRLGHHNNAAPGVGKEQGTEPNVIGCSVKLLRDGGEGGGGW